MFLSYTNLLLLCHDSRLIRFAIGHKVTKTESDTNKIRKKKKFKSYFFFVFL